MVSGHTITTSNGTKSNTITLPTGDMFLRLKIHDRLGLRTRHSGFGIQFCEPGSGFGKAIHSKTWLTALRGAVLRTLWSALQMIL